MGKSMALLAGLAAALPPSLLLLLLVLLRVAQPDAALAASLALMVLSVLVAHFLLADLYRLADGGTPSVWPFARLGRLVRAREAVEHQALRHDVAELRADRAILDALPDPLLVLTRDRSLHYINKAARAALGDEIPAVLRHPTLRSAIDRVQSADRTVESVDLLVPVPVARDLHATVIDLGPGPISARTALLFADRTRARAVERMRADFVANASHELRTPLASLIGFIETLQGPAADDGPAQKRFLAIMAEQAQRMNRLIDDLLSLSRIELTEHLAPSQQVALAALLERALTSFEIRTRTAGTTLVMDVQPGLPPVLGDEDQIEQVLQNLLDNALKYGNPAGTIEVALKEAAGGRWPARRGVVLSVRDDGPGIARVHLPRLTERFYRVDRGRSRAAGGTGLGLAIVKHIVNRHRGQLAIDSEEGLGSTFSVWLPLAA